MVRPAHLIALFSFQRAIKNTSKLLGRVNYFTPSATVCKSELSFFVVFYKKIQKIIAFFYRRYFSEITKKRAKKTSLQ